MKQHITVEQLEKLSDSQICKLNTLMKHKWHLTQEEFEKYNWNKVLKDMANYCTIGKMIEIWENHQPNYWINSITHFNNLGNVYLKDEYQGCLCNALWELTVWGIENNILKGEC